MTAAELIAFESRIRAAWEAGELPFLVHLCGGNEGQLIDIFKRIKPGDWILCGHRCHYHYLLAGGSADKLQDSIRRGRSMFVYDRKLNFLVSAILGGLPGVAAGLAWALREARSPGKVWCFIGDGGEDNGHFAEAVMFVEGLKLPCQFVIEDNDRSVDTTVAQRSGGYRHQWPACVMRYHYKPTYPHAGSGCAHHIVFQPVKPDPFPGL